MLRALRVRYIVDGILGSLTTMILPRVTRFVLGPFNTRWDDTNYSHFYTNPRISPLQVNVPVTSLYRFFLRKQFNSLLYKR